MTQAVDLIPSKKLVSQSVRRRILVWVGVTVAALLGVVLVTFFFERRVAQLERTGAPLRERVAAMRTRENRLAPLTHSLETAHEKQLLVGRLLVEPSWSGLLSDLAAAGNENVWLTQLDIVKEAAPERQTEERAVTSMMLTGTATSDLELIHFMTRWSQSEHVARLNLAMSRATEEEEKRGMVEFELRGAVE